MSEKTRDGFASIDFCDYKRWPVDELAIMESMNEDQLYDGWNSGTWANRITQAGAVFE